MTTKVQKWGNSLAVRIPRVFAEEAHLIPGSEVSVTVRGREIVIAARKRGKISLAALLKKVTKENIHTEVDWGPPVGREVW